MSKEDRALNPSGTQINPDADPSSQTTIIPHNQQPLVIRSYPSESQLNKSIQHAAAAQEKWARLPLSQRIAIGRGFVVRTLGGERQTCARSLAPAGKYIGLICIMGVGGVWQAAR